jgi:RNA polymerase sigma-70 factor (ECF subfamily)
MVMSIAFASAAGGFGAVLRPIRMCPALALDTWLSQMAFAQAAAGATERTLPDNELVGGVLRNDRKATAEFVQLFSGRVYGYVRSRLAPRTEMVDDVVHEVFIAAWQRLATYRGESPLEAWLVGIARHKVEDHYRDRLSRMEAWEDSGDLPDESPAAQIDLDMDRQKTAGRALAVLDSLPEHYATVLLWRYWERKSAREIAAATGRTEKAVERLLARAREQFKRRWPHGA